MSLFSRAVGGAASAGASLTNKYIDEGLAAQRAQMVADLQQSTATKIREADDAFRNDPTRVQRDRERRAGDVEFDSKAKRDATLRELNDTELRGAKRAAGDADAADEVQRKLSASKTLLPQEAERETVMARARSSATRAEEKAAGNDPDYIKAKRALALAGHVESSSSSAQAVLMRLQADDLKRLGTLYDQSIAIENDGKLSREEKDKKLKPIATTIFAIKTKTGGAAARDPEIDRVKITDEEVLPGGGSRKTERTEVRRAGGGSQEAPPYPDGTELRGKDGKVYVVSGGRPVLKEDAPKKVPEQRNAKPGPQVETTTTPAGRTVYRYTGQEQWFPTKVEALAALGARPKMADEERFDQGR